MATQDYIKNILYKSLYLLYVHVCYKNIFIYMIIFMYLFTPVTCYIIQVKCVINEIVILIKKYKISSSDIIIHTISDMFT